MFYVEGWIPLSEATRKIFQKNLEEIEGQIKLLKRPSVPRMESFDLPESDEWLQYDNTVARLRTTSRAEAAMQVWSMLDEARDLGVLTESGTVIFASKVLVEYAMPHVTTGSYVDLFLGTVGSATWEIDDEYGGSHFETVDEKRIRLGPFLHCPILVRTGDFDKAFSGEFVAIPRDSIERISQAIVEAYDQEGKLSKRDAQFRYAPGEKTTVWNMAWAEAAKKRPNLSRPGPKPRNSEFNS